MRARKTLGTVTTLSPRPDDPPEVWRRYVSTAAIDPSARSALIATLPALGPDRCAVIVPGLLRRVRGSARAEVVDAVALLCRDSPPVPAVIYALIGELFRTSGPSRVGCVRALLRAAPADGAAVALAIAAAARVRAVRAGGTREALALAEWTRLGGQDPLRDEQTPAELWRTWLQGRRMPAGLDHALLLTTAGASGAVVEQVRSVTEHLVQITGRASPGACALLSWLASECTYAEDLPASVRNPGWFSTASRVLARTAVSEAGVLASLQHVAGMLEQGPFERALTAEVLRVCVDRAQRGSHEAAVILTDAVAALVSALMSVTTVDPVYEKIVALLLGRDAKSGSSRWFADQVRVGVYNVALSNVTLGVRRMALADMEQHGVPPSVLPLLRDVARQDPDPVTRQHARQLARGERL